MKEPVKWFRYGLVDTAINPPVLVCVTEHRKDANDVKRQVIEKNALVVRRVKIILQDS